jgi:hypothetical protein
MSFAVSKIKILMSVAADNNVSEQLVPFTYKMLVRPETRDPPFDANSKVNSPFYTGDVRYPRSWESLPWQEMYLLFFDRDNFVKKVSKYVDMNKSAMKPKPENKEWMQETEINNIMIMLNCLFPIHPQSNLALSNNFENVVLGKQNKRILTDFKPVHALFGIFNFMKSFGTSAASENTPAAAPVPLSKMDFFLQYNDNRYAIKNVEWLNDVTTHSPYKNFIVDYRKVPDINLILKTLEEKTALLIDSIKDKDLMKSLYDDAKKQIDNAQPPIKDGDLMVKILEELLNNGSSLSGKEAAQKVIEFQDLIDRLNLSSINPYGFSANSPAPNSDRDGKSKTDKLKLNMIFHDKQQEFYNNNLKISAIAVLASLKAKAFAERKILMRLSDVQLDGSPEKKTNIDINSFIKKNFADSVDANDKLLQSIANVYWPRRRSTNAALYDLIDTIRLSKWTKENEWQQTMFSKVYDRFFSSNVSTEKMIPVAEDPEFKDFMPLMFAGVDTINPSSKEGNANQPNTQSFGETLEIEIKIDLLRQGFENKKCAYDDAMVSRDYQQLVDPNGRIRQFGDNKLRKFEPIQTEKKQTKKKVRGGSGHRRKTSKHFT